VDWLEWAREEKRVEEINRSNGLNFSSFRNEMGPRVLVEQGTRANVGPPLVWGAQQRLKLSAADGPHTERLEMEEEGGGVMEVERPAGLCRRQGANFRLARLYVPVKYFLSWPLSGVVALEGGYILDKLDWV